MTGTVVRIRGLKKFIDKRDGRTYCYHRATGKRLRSEFGTPEFFAELAEIDKAYQAKRKADEPPKTLEDLIRLYLASHNFQQLAVRTRKDYQGILQDLVKLERTPLLAMIDKPFVANLRDTYARHRGWHRANYLLAVLSQVFKLGCELGLIAINPARDITKLKRPKDRDRANRPWTEAERVAILDAAPPHLRLPLMIGRIVGLRIGDIVALPKAAIQNGWVVYQTQKRNVEICMPLTQELKEEILRAPPHSAETLCANSRGKPWTTDGLRTSFHKLKEELFKKGLIQPGLTFHGLRHEIASAMAEDGADDSEIATWLGQKSSAMARHYSARANKKKRIEATIIKLNKAKKERAKREQNLSGKSR